MKSRLALLSTLIILISGCKSSAKKDSAQPDWDTIFANQGLVKVDTVDRPILIDLRYSSNNNFIGKDVYGDLEDAFLQPETLEKLYTAAELLDSLHPDLNLLIWDAARPRRIQQVLWDSVDVSPEERPKYVANPETGSIHNYGGAVDLTLADDSGKPVEMGTDYDNFTYLANIDREDELLAKEELTSDQVSNRKVLREVMTKAGFIPLTSEWWHFDAYSREVTKKKFKIVE